MRCIAPVFIASLLLAAGPALAAKPYSVIDGTDWVRTEPYSYPVMIAKIDGKSYLRLDRRSLEPGKHVLEFETTHPSRVRRYHQTRSIGIVLEPCMHYYFYAKHASKYAEDWELKVLRQDKIVASCGK